VSAKQQMYENKNAYRISFNNVHHFLRMTLAVVIRYNLMQ